MYEQSRIRNHFWLLCIYCFKQIIFTSQSPFFTSQIAEFLIEKGVDIHAKDMYHRTAMHPACNRGHYDIAQMLIQHGAQVVNLLSYFTKPCFLNICNTRMHSSRMQTPLG